MLRITLTEESSSELKLTNNSLRLKKGCKAYVTVTEKLEEGFCFKLEIVIPGAEKVELEMEELFCPSDLSITTTIDLDVLLLHTTEWLAEVLIAQVCTLHFSNDSSHFEVELCSENKKSKSQTRLPSCKVPLNIAQQFLVGT